MKNLRKDAKSANLYWLFDDDNATFCPFQFPTLGQTMNNEPARTKEGCSSSCALFDIVNKGEGKADVNLCHAKYVDVKIEDTPKNNVRKLL